MSGSSDPRVDWERLGYPQMSDWLKRIRARSEAVREAAFDALHEHWLGYLSEVSPLLVPELIACLEDDTLADADSVMLLLMQIVNDAHSFAKPEHPADRRALADATLRAAAHQPNIYFRCLQRRCAVTWYVLLILEQLADYIPDLWDSLFSVMQHYTGDTEQALFFPLLARRIRLTTDAQAAGRRIAALRALTNAADTSSAVQRAARIALVHVLGNAVDFDPLGMLAEAASGGTWPDTYLLETIQRLPLEDQVTVLSAALQNRRDPLSACGVAHALLDTTFNGGIPLRFGVYVEKRAHEMDRLVFTRNGNAPLPPQTRNFSIHQRRALQALVDADTLWQAQSNLLLWYGLPNVREALASLLETPKPLTPRR